VYRGHSLNACFKPDCIVEKTVLVEVKAVSELAPVHSAQVITYLKLTGCPVGLLINFNSPLVSANIRHLVHPDLYEKREKPRLWGVAMPAGRRPGPTIGKASREETGE
jgi:hypothetical protein